MAVLVTGGTTSLCMMTSVSLMEFYRVWKNNPAMSRGLQSSGRLHYKLVGVYEMLASNRKKAFKEKDAIVFMMGDTRSCIYFFFFLTIQ